MNTVITAKHIGKKYFIGKKERYLTLRDTLTRLAKLPYDMLTQRKTLKKEEFWALKDVSFTVEQGEILGIIGRNGAGKSTLLKILSKITEPTEGAITYTGSIASLLEVGTGFHPELTGRENIFLNGAILGMARKEIKRKFDEIVSFAGVEQFIDVPVKRFSSGMQVRLAFAVAAHLEPDVLLIDEVLAVGDAAFQKKSLSKMNEVTTREGRTVILVSHNMHAIQGLCKRCMWLEKGSIRKVGTTKEVIDAYLAYTVKEEAEQTFTNEPHKEAQILKLTVRDAFDKPTTSLNYAKPFAIEVEYELKIAIPNIFVMFKLSHDLISEKYLLVSLSTDTNGQTPDQAGRYSARIDVPTFLNVGTYQFFIALTSNFIGEKIDYTRPVTITLNKDTDTPFPMVQDARDESLALLPLRWAINTIAT